MKKRTKDSSRGDQLVCRLPAALGHRFMRVVAASKRTKTSLTIEALQEQLPEFEKRWITKAA